MTDPKPELVMPFVAVSSKGGPYDDEACTCGYEMGLLDQLLAGDPDGPIVLTLHVGNRAQADLIAMRHGHSLTTTTHEDPQFHEWCFATFTKEGTA